jgi:hypothetical protein
LIQNNHGISRLTERYGPQGQQGRFLLLSHCLISFYIAKITDNRRKAKALSMTKAKKRSSRHRQLKFFYAFSEHFNKKKGYIREELCFRGVSTPRD